VLDWLVGSTDFARKPVAIINTAQRAVHDDAQHREVLATMAARSVRDTSFALPLLGRRLDDVGIANEPDVALALHDAMTALADAANFN
jgi:hypothetical protein